MAIKELVSEFSTRLEVALKQVIDIEIGNRCQMIMRSLKGAGYAEVDGALSTYFATKGYEVGQRLQMKAKAKAKAKAVKAKKPRKKQLCPVPRCKGLAAPIFGMVCSKHKDVAKSKIAKFRKARKAASK